MDVVNELMFTTTTTETKTMAATKTETKRDAFGSREGSISFDINKVLINAKGKVVTRETIAEKSGASAARVAAHIKWLSDRDHITVTDTGAKAKGTTRKRTTKAKK